MLLVAAVVRRQGVVVDRNRRALVADLRQQPRSRRSVGDGRARWCCSPVASRAPKPLSKRTVGASSADDGHGVEGAAGGETDGGVENHQRHDAVGDGHLYPAGRRVHRRVEAAPSDHCPQQAQDQAPPSRIDVVGQADAPRLGSQPNKAMPAIITAAAATICSRSLRRASLRAIQVKPAM